AAMVSLLRQHVPRGGVFDSALAAFDALDGDYELAFYFDARLSITAAAHQDSAVAPLGTVIGRARAADARAALARSGDFLRALGATPLSPAGGARLLFRYLEEPVELRFENGF